MAKLYKAFFGWFLLFLLLCSGVFIFHTRWDNQSPKEYRDLIFRYSLEYDLDPYLVQAVIRTESNFDPRARSNADAVGLMQITQETLNWATMREGKNQTFNEEDLYEPEINVRYGCLILSLLSQEFKDSNTVLAAYNAGRGNVLKWLKDSRYSTDGKVLRKTPFEETNQYIKRVKKHYNHYKKTGEES